MLTREQVDAVIRLLADPDRPSNRKIAELVGVSRQSVNRLASGRRGLHAREDAVVDQAVDEAPPRKCPRCGCLRRRRCVRCDAEAYARRERDRKRRNPVAPPNRCSAR